MPLVRPLVVGPVSTISRRIRVRGQLAGADVRVLSLGPSNRVLAAGMAGSADDRLELDPSEQLQADDVLYAIQELDGETSPTPMPGDPLGVQVQQAPGNASALTHVTYASILFVCGRQVRLRGGIPGATAIVDEGGSTLGSGTFEDADGARFGISPAFFSSTVAARQSIPGLGDGPAVFRLPQDLPGSANGPLDAPVIDPVPVACSTSVRIGRVFDGAEVTLRRDDGITVVDQQFMFDAPALWAPVGRPLVEGETLTVSQAVHPECSRPPVSRDIRVDRALPIPKPIVAGPLCAGASWIHVDGLLPGARVEILANGTVYQAQTPTQGTSVDAIVDPLEAPAAGQTRVVIARQEQCGVFGPDSDPIGVDPLPATTPQHEILRPLLACSPIVRVANAQPGAILIAVSDTFGPISGFARANPGGGAVIAVAPQLADGDTIKVLQWACGGDPTEAREPVEFTEDVPIPEVGEAHIGRSRVEIENLTPGATIEVAVTSDAGVLKEVNSFVADERIGEAHFQTPLAPGDRVKARQGLCGSLSGYSSERVAAVEPIGSDWWAWSGANPRNETWKEEYVVSGTFTNSGGTNITDFGVTVFEDAANVGTTNHTLVTPSQAVPGATAPIKKDWQWFIPGAWIVKGPLHKEYHYTVVVSAKDVAGTPYPPTTFAELRIFVNVSKIKRTAGAYAMGMSASAAAMAASIILLAAAAAAYAAASLAGAVALDPPEPDPDYRNQIALPPLGQVPAAGPDQKIIRLFRLGERVMGIELAKSMIEGRRLGALAADDEAWVAIHDQDLADATLLQKELIAEAADLGPSVRQDVLTHVPAGTDLGPERMRLHAEGLTLALAQEMGLPDDLRPGFDTLLRSELEIPNPDIDRAVADSLQALVEFGQDLE